MEYLKINGEQFYNMVVHANNKLEQQKEYVNSLNVFPVPDGDTGTNMSMTFRAAVKEIENKGIKSIGEASKVLAKGALMGARGNSGVILSQILRGISKGLENKTEVNAQEFAQALTEGAKSAYKAVMRPTEGTILTVIRGAGESAVASTKTDMTELMEEVCTHAKIVLDKTPEMLPALKKAKVVDSGGMGLFILLQGMYEALNQDIKATIEEYHKASGNVSVAHNLQDHDIKFGYCTEFIILGDSSKAEEFKNTINQYGDSMIVVGYEDVIKVHIHTNDPGTVLSKAVALGELSKIKIDNMREEHRSLIVEDSQAEKEYASEEAANEEPKKFGFISVASGEGIKKIFMDLGVDFVIEGGQTMNPSTQDIIECVDKLNAENIFILPNNKNIIMAATQAAEISEKNIVVIPTKTIPQGVSCLTMFNPETELQDNINEMNEVISTVATGSITYAVRDTEMDGIEIKEGNILGLLEGKIKEVGQDVYKVTEELIQHMVNEDSALITLFYGKECDEAKAEELRAKLENYPDLDVQSYNGDQPLYYFIISVE
ncbi:DAK2 domain-containing protein [Clostridium polynesiense]|uniref:DAK2 domain-containing protein n=1 Tax=Clostridium polynesiense TaxID=1325933 RepID=UPI000590AE01|nr:DAK2 domain-containing protein [Clostridium polynesiense]